MTNKNDAGVGESSSVVIHLAFTLALRDLENARFRNTRNHKITYLVAI